MRLLLLAAISLLVLAACGSEPVSKKPSIAANSAQSCVSVGRNPNHPNSCAKVIDQPFEGTIGEPESIKWFLNKKNTKVNRISHFKKYCKTPQPDTTNMDQKRRAKVLTKWRNDRWDCAKKKHNEKIQYWVAYLEGKDAALKEVSGDWLTNWGNKYRAEIDKIETFRYDRRPTQSFENLVCQNQNYRWGYSDIDGTISCSY